MLPLTRSRNRARFFGTPFSPEALFAGGTVAGAWYDPSDLSTLFTTSAGTTPVAMPGQGSAVSVGRMLDKSGNGNHAIAFNDTTARPELRARVNLLTYSEEFDNGAWTKFFSTVTQNAAVAPNGTTTAEKLIPNNGATSGFIFSPNASPVVGAQYVASVYVKAAELGFAFVVCNVRALSSTGVCINLATGALTNQGANGTYTVVDAGNGWWQVTATVTATIFNGYLEVWPLAAAGVNGSYTGNGTSGIYIWGADLRPANIGANVPAYQRIADANTYDTSGFPLYLLFDGIDDSMYTPANLNLSGTDKVSVFAGVRKLAAGVVNIAAELSANSDSNFGAFGIGAPVNTKQYYWQLNAGNRVDGAVNSGYDSPITNVLTGNFDIAGTAPIDEIKGRLNGVDQTLAFSGVVGAGSGNFGTYPLYIGSRNNSNFFFNGQLYSLIIAGSAVSAGNISATEQWVAQRTGIVIP